MTMAAAQALEGKFSEDGVAAMAGEDNLQMALAKNLSERIDDADMQRTWGKVKSGPKKVKRPTTSVAEMTKAPKPSPLDSMPIELQMVAETMIEDQGKPVPVEALADFPRLAADLAALDAGFDALESSREFTEHDADVGEEADEVEDGDLDAPVSATVLKFDPNFDKEYVPEPAADDEELTEEILAKMFANMVAHGLEVG
jgi:hypothetical protein